LDEDTQVNPKVTKNEKGTRIGIDFVKKVVGSASKHNFSISFDTSEITQNSGNIWEVNIPGIDSQSPADTFNVRLNFPTSLGTLAYIKPKIGHLNIIGNSILFTKEDLGGLGLSISFGDYQAYDFTLKYHLENNNLFPTRQSIALPPDTNYQEVRIDDISPTPLNVQKDYDGNYLAKYSLSPGKKIDVTVKGSVKILLKPKPQYLSSDQRMKYLQQRPYWQSDDPKIKELAEKLKTPRSIYDYVSKNLSYDFSRVKDNQQRLGAINVLQNPSSAVCLEFTDLFIALSRAAGIPAREVNGFAYTQNSKERPLSLVKDILHAWPQYYDEEQKSWVMVDPTWANTTGGLDYFDTLDFDHVAFVIQGLDSQYPIPAGGYKTSRSISGKDIEILPSRNFTKGQSTLSLQPKISQAYIAGAPIEGNIVFQNKGDATSSDNFILVSTTNLNPSVQNFRVEQIPPGGSISIPISFNKTEVLTNKKVTIKIQFNGTTLYEDFYIRPFFYSMWFILGGITIGVSFITIFIYIRRSRRIYLQGRKQSDPLRRQS